ncbi:unnamed protein product [Urochloa humidicola]
MDQQQPRLPDHVVVDIELQPVNADVAKPLPQAGIIADCHVVDMELVQDTRVGGGDPAPERCLVVAEAAKHGGADDDDDGSCCVVCTEPLEWVVIGRCGHRVVCATCMVRIRFFHQNKRCCICRTRCAKVLVARWDAAAATANLPVALPRFTFREGRVGKYWYHKHTAAYFEDEQQYDMARAACHGILSPFYQPLFCFIYWFGSVLFIGAVMGGSGFASQTKHRPSQVIAYALAIFCALLVSTFIWSILKCTQDPLQLENSRKVDAGIPMA